MQTNCSYETHLAQELRLTYSFSANGTLLCVITKLPVGNCLIMRIISFANYRQKLPCLFEEKVAGTTEIS